MIRLKGICPSCEQQVEWYADHLVPAGYSYRCGNCFQPVTDDQLKRFEKLYEDLHQHELEKQHMLQDALRR
jgi:predicted amidophosphoribosyltransferase